MELLRFYEKLVSIFDLTTDIQQQLKAQLPGEDEIAVAKRLSEQAHKNEKQKEKDYWQREAERMMPVKQLFEQLTYSEKILLQGILYDRNEERLLLRMVKEGSMLQLLINNYLYPDGKRDAGVAGFLKDLIPPVSNYHFSS